MNKEIASAFCLQTADRVSVCVKMCQKAKGNLSCLDECSLRMAKAEATLHRLWNVDARKSDSLS